MLNTLTIRNFQSLTDVSLDLAPLVVIVGRSSSGKSALIRSLTALIRNRRGTEFITHGERTAAITAHFTNGTVTLTRSTQTAPNSYTIIPADPHHALAPKADFTKLGGDVPGPVSEFIGIPTALAPLSIASQFDAPYLLSAPPAEAARIFGSLTNASVLLDASRESNRRKLASAALLRTRTADLALIQARVPEFQALRTQTTALATAESLITQARALSDRLSRLTAAIDTLSIAQQRIPALTAALSALPDTQALTASLDALQARYAFLTRSHQAIQTRAQSYSQALTALRTTASSAKQARVQLALSETAVTSATQDLASALSGFEEALASYLLDHSQTLDPENRLDRHEAAMLATAYVTSLDA